MAADFSLCRTRPADRRHSLPCALPVRSSSRAQKTEPKQGDDKRPSLSLKVTPPLGFSPLRVHASVDVRGGADDSIDFYCPAIQWDWSDGTVSETSEDCDPYQEGTSTIRRRFSSDHTFHRVAPTGDVPLKQKNRSWRRPPPTFRCARAYATILAADVSVDAVMADVQGRVRERLRQHLVRHGAAAFEDPVLFAEVERLLRTSIDAGRFPRARVPSCSASPRRGDSRPP
jgi:hypothetical protein